MVQSPTAGVRPRSVQPKHQRASREMPQLRTGRTCGPEVSYSLPSFSAPSWSIRSSKWNVILQDLLGFYQSRNAKAIPKPCGNLDSLAWVEKALYGEDSTKVFGESSGSVPENAAGSRHQGTKS